MSRTFVIVLLLILTALSASSGSHAQQLGPSFWKNECETPWGTIIYGGESVTAYQSATGDNFLFHHDASNVNSFSQFPKPAGG